MTTMATPARRTASSGPVTPDVSPELRLALLEVARSAVHVAVGLASGWALASRIRHAGGTDLRAAVFVTLTGTGDRMLGAVCPKAGLPADAWRTPGTRCLVFQTVRLGGRVIEAGAAR